MRWSGWLARRTPPSRRPTRDRPPSSPTFWPCSSGRSVPASPPCGWSRPSVAR
jgi:hypothetical protein